MEEEERFLRGRKKAMAVLSHKDRTRWELADKLRQAGFDEEVTEDALAYVEGFHYIDDLRYATHFAEIYCESRSIRRIRQDLEKRHVPEEYIDIALESIHMDDSRALQKAVKKLLKDEETVTYEEKQKIAAKLYRKGFRMGDIFRELNL